jgi:hypothetical protein
MLHPKAKRARLPWSEGTQQKPSGAEFVSKADLDAAMVKLNAAVESATRRVQSQGDKAAHIVERTMQQKMEALQRAYEDQLQRVTSPEELRQAREAVQVQVGAIEAQGLKEQLEQQKVETFIRDHLAHEGVSPDDPDLEPSAWTNQKAFLHNVELVKKRMAAEAKIKDLEGKLSLTAKQRQELDAARQQAENLSEAAQGAGVGASVPGKSGPRDYLKVPKEDFEKERERLRSQFYK